MSFSQLYQQIIPFLKKHLPLSGVLVLVAMCSISHAEISLDGSLGPSGPLTGPDYVISDDMGHRAGNNLFHSFGVFDVLTGESATFIGPNAIENVIGRVTGGNQSFIDGRLGCSISGADLFLMNPNGIMFGPNASIDVSGSFHVSTADFIRLSDGGIFDSNPLNGSVLTVASPSAFGFMDDNPAHITLDNSLLEVSGNETISIVGGDITMTGSTVYAPEGQINLASTASSGEIALNGDILGADTFDNRGTISVSHSSSNHTEINGTIIGDLDVSGQKAGTISIRGGHFVLDKGYLYAMTNGATDCDGGVTLDVDSLEMTNGSGFSTITFGAGSGGDLTIDADTVLLSESYLWSYSDDTASGSAGDTSLNVGALTLTGGSYINTDSYGDGDGGDLEVSAAGSVLFSNPGSGIYSRAWANGNAGDVSLNVGALTLTDGGKIDTSSKDAGRGGHLSITATDSVSLSGDNSAILSKAFWGNSGGLSLDTSSLSINSGAQIDTSSTRSGKGGQITITAENIEISDRGSIFSYARYQGDAGDINISASTGILISCASGDRNSTGIISEALYTVIGNTIYLGSGDAGDIDILTPSLVMDCGLISTDSSLYSKGNSGDLSIDAEYFSARNGALISSDTNYYYDSAGLGGDGGTIHITSESASLSGSSFNSGTYAGGNSGEMILEMGSLDLTDGSTINTASRGSGAGGDLRITSESASLSGSNFNGGTYAGGNSGEMILEMGSLTLTDSSLISTATLGSGAGGDLRITADSVSLSNGSLFCNAEGSGNAGDIYMDVGSLAMSNVGYISANANSSGAGGDIHITADEMSLSASVLASSGKNGAEGILGNIHLNIGALDMTNGGHIITSSYNDMGGGNIYIDGGAVSVDNSYMHSAVSGSGDAGDIVLDVMSLEMSNNGYMITMSHGAGNGGDLIISSNFVGLTDSELTSESFGQGDAGNISLDIRDTTHLKNSTIRTESQNASGGNIQLNSKYMLCLQDSTITSSVHGNENTVGGDINIDPEYVILDHSSIIANAFEGTGGNIGLVADVFLADPGSLVDASSALGIDGQVDIQAPITNTSGLMAPLQKDFQSAAELLRSPCMARIQGGKYSSFVIASRDGLPLEPGGLMPSPLFLK